MADAGNLLSLTELALIEIVLVNFLKLLHGGCRLKPLEGLSGQPPVAEGPSSHRQVLEQVIPVKDRQLLEPTSKVIHLNG